MLLLDMLLGCNLWPVFTGLDLWQKHLCLWGIKFFFFFFLNRVKQLVNTGLVGPQAAFSRVQQACWPLGVQRRPFLMDIPHGKVEEVSWERQQGCQTGRQGPGTWGAGRGGLRSDTSTAEGGEGQLGRGPCVPSLLVDLGQQQDKGHGQGAVVEAVNVGVIPFLWRRTSQSGPLPFPKLSSPRHLVPLPAIPP